MLEKLSNTICTPSCTFCQAKHQGPCIVLTQCCFWSECLFSLDSIRLQFITPSVSAQIQSFHSQHLGHWLSLPIVTFVLSDRPRAADGANHMSKYTLCSLIHPKAFLLSSQPTSKQYDNQGLFRLAPLTLNIPHLLQPLSIKTCCSNTHLLDSPQICFSSCVQQVGVIPSALWNLTLWESNGSVTNLPGEGPESWSKTLSLQTKHTHGYCLAKHATTTFASASIFWLASSTAASALHRHAEWAPRLLNFYRHRELYTQLLSQTKLSLISQNQSLNVGMMTVEESWNTVFFNSANHDVYPRTKSGTEWCHIVMMQFLYRMCQYIFAENNMLS